ncbi:MAG: glutamine synthetase III [Clostridia bacterium]|nr:glutamine synthetase III [Clostridia bacterium]
MIAKNIPEMFGSMVFNDKAMKEYLPEDVYTALNKTIENGKSLDKTIADDVANGMKEWALSKGATHYSHWFQPMTGITAEKHDSFITPDKKGGIMMEFSGKELIKGESDASSFPNGGLRATFEARGYTAWDPTAYAFIKDDTLCIPTVFYSYGGEALDKKTPLLRSDEALNRQAMRILKLFGNDDVTKTVTTVGPEQEYFLIDEDVYRTRKDLVLCGRTLFGAMPPKGQEMGDHYFGTIKPRVMNFMKDLDEELWKLGIYAKTEHNEAAPAQHELAPIYSRTNTAADHNQLTMELMKKIARRHGMACLLHEKPFDGVNGSGKHNNWSISTNTGVNLLDPGDSPRENTQFLLFLSAIIKAVDEHQDLMRFSVASAGNDHRLGADEAPPAIISVFLGDELDAILSSIENGTVYAPENAIVMKGGVHTLPRFSRDTTDRNRTSPFAFTNNKFEFRMLGSSASIADPNIILNTIIADTLAEFADILEGANDFNATLQQLIQDTIKKHKRIIFNGNNYSQDWVKEAQNRGLLNLRTTMDVLPYFVRQENIDLFTRHKVFTAEEMHSRYEIMVENYCKTLHIEALTLIDMIKNDLLPAAFREENQLATTLIQKKKALPKAPCKAEESMLQQLATLTDQLHSGCNEFERALKAAEAISDFYKQGLFYQSTIFTGLHSLRNTIDKMEALIPADIWPYPTYYDLLFSVY